MDNYGHSAIYWAAFFGYEDILEYFLIKFPFDIERKTFSGCTPLGGAFYNNSLTWKQLITKGAKNVIYWWLWSQTETDSINQAPLIKLDKTQNLSKIIKEDFEKLQRDGLFQEDDVKRGIPRLAVYCEKHCKQHGKDFFAHCLGNEYKIEGPILWRYRKDRKSHFVANFLLGRWYTGKISIALEKEQIKVNQ